MIKVKSGKKSEQNKHAEMLEKTIELYAHGGRSAVIDFINSIEDPAVSKEWTVFFFDHASWSIEQLEAYKIEKFGPPVIPHTLFDDEELFKPLDASTGQPVEEASEDSVEEEEKKKSKKQKKRQYLESTTLETHQITLDPVMTECPECGTKLVITGYNIQKKLKRTPSVYYYEEIRTPIMECPKCSDDNGNSLTFRQEPQPDLIEGSSVTASVIAGLVNDLFIAGIPLNRQEAICKTKGLILSKQLMCFWIDYCFDFYIKRVSDMMREIFRTQKYVHIDESPHKIVENRKERFTSYEICGVSGRSEEIQIIIFMFSRTRSISFFRDLVGEDYEGVFQTDGYGVYQTADDQLPMAQNIGCWCHAQKRFKEALEIDSGYRELAKMSEKKQREFLEKHTVLREFIKLREMISKIFKIEQELNDTYEPQRNWEAIAEERQKRIIPLLDEIFSHATRLYPQLRPKSKQAGAISYLLNQEVYLRRVFENGEREIHNMEVENQIKRYAIWRNNSLFSFSEKGAIRSSGYMTVLMTAKRNGLDPEKYIGWLLEEMSSRTISDYELLDLMPWSDKLPEDLKPH